MIVAVDVAYESDRAVAACVVFGDWADARAVEEQVVEVGEPAAYEPGQFFRRELPAVRAALDVVSRRFHTVVVDGYVWLDAAEQRPGLGAHLHAALDGRVTVIGVAKSPFNGAGAVAVTRGTSSRPLYVTAVGVDVGVAAEYVRQMHGSHRIPTLLRRVDGLARGLVSANGPY